MERQLDFLRLLYSSNMYTEVLSEDGSVSELLGLNFPSSLLLQNNQP